tara:strand:+ start:199 stop:993 length:795 start_codon:yes stop_codon:yes gene_type:complete
MFPIFIPSHNRPLSCKFCYDCKELELPFKIFIYKSQLDSYLKNFRKNQIVVVPSYISNLVQKRQYILDYARKEGHDWFFMIDDNIQKITYRKIKGEKLKLLSYVDFFNKIYDLLIDIDQKYPTHKLAQIGFKNSPFAIKDKPITMNTEIASIVLFNIKNTLETNYWDCIGCEDLAYNLELLLENKNTMKFNHIIFFMPKSGSQKGGLEDYYTNGGKQEGIDKLKSSYNDFVKIFDDNKYRVKWGKFKDSTLEQEYTNAFKVVFD